MKPTFPTSTALLAAAFCALSLSVNAQQWTKIQPLPATRDSHGAATGPDGVVYVVGGMRATQLQCTATMEQYDPRTNGPWVSAPSMRVARCHPGVVTGADGYIYVIGGDVGNESTNVVERYDTRTKTWQTMASLNVPRGRPAVAVGPDLRIYAIGGHHQPTSTPRNQIEVYDATTNQWLRLQPMAPGARIAATRLDGNIITFGVGPGSRWALFDGKWTDKGAVTPANNGDQTAAAGPDGRTYVMALGIGNKLSGGSAVTAYDVAGTPSTMPNLLQGRGSAGAATAAEGRIFLTGGYVGGNLGGNAGQLTSVETFGPLHAPLFPGTSAWWRFDEPSGTAIVDSAGAATANIAGGAVRVPGRVGNAISFNGTSQWVKVDDRPSINFGSGDFTIEGWLKWTSAGLHVTTVLDKRTRAGGKYQGYSLFVYKGRIGLQLANGATYANYGASSTTIEPGQWTHFAVTVDRTSKKLTFYVNGVVDKAQHVPLTGSVTSAAPLVIGRHSFDNSYYKGAVDELTLVARPLRWAEIRAIFLAGREGR